MAVELDKLQRCCLNIMDEIDQICRQNNIEYSLCGGSVIGASLYNGFIPWDDDIDVMMTRENYDRFLEVFPRQMRTDFHLRHYMIDGVDSLPALFARVEDTNTETLEEIAGSYRKGRIFVDITVYDTVPNMLTYQFFRLYAGYVYTNLYRMNGMIPGTGWKRLLFRLFAGNARGEQLQKKYARLENCLRKASSIRKKSIAAEFLSAAFSGKVYDPSIFHSYRDIEFEGRQYRIIEKYNDYLFMRYGKREFSRDVPEESRQKSHIKELIIKKG